MKDYKQYLNDYTFWQNYGGMINYIRKIWDEIRKYKSDEKAQEIRDLEQEIIDLINKNLEKAQLINAKNAPRD